MGKEEEVGKYSESSETVEGWNERRESVRSETGKEEAGRGVEEWIVLSSASSSPPSSISESGGDLAAKEKMEKWLGGEEEDIEAKDMGEDGEPRTEEEGGGELEVEDASRRSRSRRAVGRDSVWVWSH